MNQAMELAIISIFNNIPREILQIGFQDKEPFEATLPLEQLIISRVIRKRVLKEVNVFGGKTTQIVLHYKYLEEFRYDESDYYARTGIYSLYRIPPEEREYCPIVEVHNLMYAGNYAGHYPQSSGWMGGQTVPSLGQAVLDSHTFASSPPKPMVEVLNGDLIKLTPSQHAHVPWLMSCRISYDENATNMATNMIEPFAKVCTAAVKAYLYNTMIIRLNKAYITQGYELSEYKSIIDRYADQEERYQELKNELAGAAMLSPDRIMTILKYRL